jgi:excisionase family DNA binding protein
MPPPSTLDNLIGQATCTVEQAAEILGVARGTAYEACRLGQLPTLRLGRRVLVPVPRLLAMLGAPVDVVGPEEHPVISVPQPDPTEASTEPSAGLSKPSNGFHPTTDTIVT